MRMNTIIGPGPLFTKRTDVLPQDVAKSRRRKIQIKTFSNRSAIWQAPRQHRCRNACQFSER